METMHTSKTLIFESSVKELKEKNNSFDSGVLRIAYTGENRNGTFIAKETFEKSLATLAYCPIVCHYKREDDAIGGHDVELSVDADGLPVLVNQTTPVGCVPESATPYWETVTEEDGTAHEYLCTEALLWKRESAYQKIRENGITSVSMEIDVQEGKEVEGVYHIDDFTFTAIAVIGVEPCFESASLALFAKDESFDEKYAAMLEELKAQEAQGTEPEQADFEAETPKDTKESCEEQPEVEEESTPEEEEPFAKLQADLEEAVTKLEAKEAEFATLQEELTALRNYKAKVEQEQYQAQVEAIFSDFTDLAEVEEFEALKTLCETSAMDLEVLREKCYAIRGKFAYTHKAQEQVATFKLPVKKQTETKPSPYGGLFQKYGMN